MTTTDQRRDISEFLCVFWDAECCDPENWEYVPSTYGVEGAHLVGHPQMKLWDELNSNWQNPGRRGGIDIGKCREMRSDIEQNGINYKEGSMIYWEADTSNKINAFHREYVSSEIDIPGWMGQAMRFDSQVAKVRFACKSNNRRNLVHSNSSVDDVETSVREVIQLLGTYTTAAIQAEVKELGEHLSDTTRDTICTRIINDFTFDKKMKQVDRYTKRNADAIPTILERIDDPWVEEFWNDPDQITHVCYTQNFDQRAGALLAAADEAASVPAPLNIIWSVPVPRPNQTLDVLRQKVFTFQLKGLEDKLLNLFHLTEHHRQFFPWNHPDAQHRFVAQHRDEPIEVLIKIPNRNFN